MVVQKIKINDISFDIRFDEGIQHKSSLVIFLHGFKSFRNWGFIPYICSKFASAGLISLNLDFEFNGILTENPVQFDIEKFAMNNVSKELENINFLLSLLNELHSAKSLQQDFFKNFASIENSDDFEILNKILEQKWNGKVSLVGHSRGGGISILAARDNNIVDKIGLLAPIAHFDRYTPRLKAKWIDEGYLEFNDSMSKQTLKMNSDYVLDLEQNKDRFNLIKFAETLANPVFIIHGENDVSVPLSEVEDLVNSLKKNEINQFTSRNFVIIKKANHLFNINHPFEKSNPYLDEVCDLLISFLKE